MAPVPAPFGSWPSPVSAQLLTAPRLGSGHIQADGDTLWWEELRPAEGGRTQLVRRAPDGTVRDVLPDGFGARTLVHEYGGGAWAVQDDVLVFANLEDQRVYRLDPRSGDPLPVTPAPNVQQSQRYADLAVLPDGSLGPGQWLVAVRENHDPAVLAEHGEPRNEIVALPLDGSAAEDPTAVTVLVSGADFVIAPRWLDGRLAWVQWDHPNMPWDSTALLTAPVTRGPSGPSLGDPVCVAGGPGRPPESVLEPTWDPDGALWFLSDRDNWWNLYRWDGQRNVHVGEVAAEIGRPGSGLGGHAYAFLPDGRVVAALNSHGRCRLALVDPSHPDRPPSDFGDGLTNVDMVVTTASGAVAAMAGGPTLPMGPVRVSLDGQVEPLRPTASAELDSALVTTPEPVTFRSSGGRTAYATLYRPRNPEVRAPEGELPPLLVILHGGPTGQGRTALNPSVQYWTTRGFAVADVDYTGSTGYGREFRHALYGQWGVFDVEDCLAVVRHLAEAGVVDGARTAIRGGSAGGFTVLAVLTHPENPFAAGANYYGIADLEILGRDTHKFESRYLDQVVGPLPEAQQTYVERSPITHVDRLRVPLAVFQGADDDVVPPEQSRIIVAAVRAKGLPCVYLEFEGEQHGFRGADAVIRSIETELWFYGKVFGFDPPLAIEPHPDDSGF